MVKHEQFLKLFLRIIGIARFCATSARRSPSSEQCCSRLTLLKVCRYTGILFERPVNTTFGVFILVSTRRFLGLVAAESAGGVRYKNDSYCWELTPVFAAIAGRSGLSSRPDAGEDEKCGKA